MITRAQYLTLRTLADGEWHIGKRMTQEGAVLSTVASALWRQGLVDRRGESSGPKPQASGFEYRILPGGLKAVTEYADTVEVVPTGQRVAHSRHCGGCHGRGCPIVALVTQRRVRVAHASLREGDVGTVIGPATQIGMDLVVEFEPGVLAEYRAWELDPA